MMPDEETTEDPGEILVADDDLATLRLLADTLASEGYRVRPANSGELALASVEARHPELILLDVRMPGLDGYEVCRRLKSNEGTRGIPVLFLGALDETEDRVRAFEVGGQDFVPKPFQRGELLARVRSHLGLRRLQARLERVNQEVEERVRVRTRELAEAIGRLEVEIDQRKRTEETLRLARSEAEAAHAQLEAAFQAMADGVLVFDMDGKVVLVNESEARICGCRDTEEMKRDLDYFARTFVLNDLDGSRVPVEQWPVSRVLRGESLADLELQGRRLDTGAEWFFSFFGEPIRDEHGQQVLALVVTRDATDRRRAEEAIRQLNEQLEKRVEERTAELASANRELEAFSYTVSHDLRAPLRHIEGFIDLFMERSGGAVDDEGLQHLQVIKKAARKMASLIDDLLSFSRLGRAELHGCLFPLGSLVEEVLEDLRPLLGERKVTFRVEPLPVVRADRALMKVALANLLGNAVKFTRNVEEPTVEISLRPQHSGLEEVVLSIRDNGAGFDMRYASKLFGVFQRLHREREFEGTGIGLATVRRIVERHGGRVWAEGEVGKGATFFLCLPVPPPQGPP